MPESPADAAPPAHAWIADGTATSPRGFRAAAAAAGLKASGGLDVALLVSNRAAAAAGVFTRNQVAAAPVIVDRAVLAAGADGLRAVVANAGIANACTGPGGLDDARAMQRLAAAALGDVGPAQVLVLSTGVIGRRLPMDRLAAGIAHAAGHLDAGGGAALARAIMTTDTRPKQCALRVRLAGGDAVIGGVAKGSGMIHPDMATMLAVVTTDARAGARDLDRALRQAVDGSFNRISVDGDTSTNDTVLLLANGAAGAAVETTADHAAFQAGLDAVCLALAHAIVRDGEGATRFVTIRVTGAPDAAAATAVARTIATSPLVKTALAGGDPNWGRILAAAGRAGVSIDPERLSLAVAPAGAAADDATAHAGARVLPPVELVHRGLPFRDAEREAAAVFALPELTLALDLGLGDGAATYWTTDLTAAYVAINADYTT